MATELTTAESSTSFRATKRKLDEAIQSLDDVTFHESLERPSPAKRPNTARSLYSTLTKYGIRSNEAKSPSPVDTLSKNTPHLSAILTRAATRTRKALPFKLPATPASSSSLSSPLSTSEYRPSSVPSFLSRLSTYKLATYSTKPPSIDAVAASKRGWINDGKDRLVCGICNVSWVVAGREGLHKDAANALIEKQRVSLVENHKSGCPWKTRQCDDSIYRIPLQSPATMAKHIKISAVALEPVLQGVGIKHPLTSTQLNSLRTAIHSISISLPPSTSNPPEPSSQSPFPSPSPFLSPSTPAPAPTPEPEPLGAEPSDTAILVSLFGWVLAPSPPERPRVSSLSLSRANSMLPSTPPPRTPSLSRSRASSVTSSRAHTPTPTPAPALTTPAPGAFTRTGTSEKPKPTVKRDTSLLHCSLCQRRVGLWAFSPPPSPSIPIPNSDNVESTLAGVNDASSKKAPPQRNFDLLKEHRSYCPYVVRSTVIPSLPSHSHPPSLAVNTHTRSTSSLSQYPNGNGNSNGNGASALEGWRAVLTVVLRYGMGQRRRMGVPRGLGLGGNHGMDGNRGHGHGRGDGDGNHGEGEREREGEREGEREREGEGEGEGERDMEVDGVEAMVSDVKSRGGKELLRYVRGLLG